MNKTKQKKNQKTTNKDLQIIRNQERGKYADSL